MMTTDRGPRGADAFSLTPTGWGRFFFDIPFLAVWLSFWLVFEVAVIAVLGGILAGAVGRVFGIELSFASRLGPDGSAPFFLIFLLVWLTMWTVGGIAAGTHFLRVLAGRDTVSVSPAGLEIEWRAGPFRRRRTIAHHDLRRLRVNMQGDGVVVDTADGTVDITKFGTREERAAILAWLKTRLVLPDEAQSKRLDAENTPKDWGVEVTGMDTHLFRPTRRVRRNMALVLWAIVALVLVTGVLPALGSGSIDQNVIELESVRVPSRSSGITGAHLAAAGLAGFFALWASWLTWGRSEWIVGHGRMTWRRSFGSWMRERTFENATLDIERSFDSDGDAHFTLRVKAATSNRKIITALHEPADLLRLAEWLSARTRFPIT